MKIVLSVAVAIVTAMIPLGAEVARAGKPGPYLSSWEAPQQGPYLQVGNPYPRSWVREYPSPIYRQPLGRTYLGGRFSYGGTTRSTTSRSETVIVAPEAETIIIYQEGNSGGQRRRIITDDGVYRVYGGDRDDFFPDSRRYRSYGSLGTYQYRPPYPYGNTGSRTLRSCYPASWRNSPFHSVSARQSCY